MVNLCFFFLSSLNCITSNKNEKGHSSYISPLHMSIILEMSIWRNQYCTEMSHFKSREKKTSLRKTNITKAKSRGGLQALVPHCLGIQHISSSPPCVSFTYYLFIYLLIYFCFQSAGRLHVVLVYAEWFPSWLKFHFGHRPYSACRTQRWNEKRKPNQKNPLNP